MKKISTKIMLPLLLLTVAAMLSSVNGVIGIQKVREQAVIITDSYIPELVEQNNLSTKFQYMQRLLLKHCMLNSASGMTAVETDITTATESLEASIAFLKERVKPGTYAEKQFGIFINAYEKFMTNYHNAITLSNTGDKVAAGELANGIIATLTTNMEKQITNMFNSTQEAVQASTAEQEALYKERLVVTVISSVITVTLGIIILILIRRTIVRPIVSVQKHLDDIIQKIQNNEGDLTDRIRIKSKDELGLLVNGINSFLETLQSILSDIISASAKLNLVTAHVSDNIKNSTDNANDISALTEELSATMEEVASTMETVLDGTKNADSEVGAVNDASMQLLDYSAKMSERAKALEQLAVRSKEAAKESVSLNLKKLREAIENSKSAYQVNELTADILSIADETNLLSLNASIEAARAGDAGLGFAVVADEIRKLADSSMQTAEGIQHITEVVIHAVEQLSNSAEEIVSYIESTMLPDYDTFVSSGQSYLDDANVIHETMSGCAEKYARLNGLIHNIASAVDGITASIDEGAQGVQQTASGIMTLVSEMTQINHEMSTGTEVSAVLSDAAKAFRTVKEEA